MTPVEFFRAVEKILVKTKGSRPIGCYCFIHEMDQLVGEWETENDDEETKEFFKAASEGSLI